MIQYYGKHEAGGRWTHSTSMNMNGINLVVLIGWVIRLIVKFEWLTIMLTLMDVSIQLCRCTMSPEELRSKWDWSSDCIRLHIISEFHIDDGCSIRFLIRWLWRMHLADIMNIMVMLGLWKWICIQCKSSACIWAIMQWLARYPSCPGDCMMRWQYLAKQSRSRWVPLSWACFNADAA